MEIDPLAKFWFSVAGVLVLEEVIRFLARQSVTERWRWIATVFLMGVFVQSRSVKEPQDQGPVPADPVQQGVDQHEGQDHAQDVRAMFGHGIVPRKS
jgi:hypothetical protein